MKVTFIATVYNEESTITDLLQSLLSQSKLPDEIVIVDGGSIDASESIISSYKSKFVNKQTKFKFIVKKGNRSVGRNEAIRNSSNETIVCSDAGCILDKDWIKNIVKAFTNQKVYVVAGYYKPITNNVFEKSLSAYTCAMEDKLDKNIFLPSSRSIAFKKMVWKKIGGYREDLDTCEDLVFAKQLKKRGFCFSLAKEAVVYWPQRKNLIEAYLQFYNYAKGDGMARYFRPQTPLLFVRYILGGILFITFLIFRSHFILNIVQISLLAYIFWAISKNYKYVKSLQAIFYLPLIQFTSDIAVMMGTVSGLLTQKAKILIEGIIYTLTIYLILLFNFRPLRSLFNPQRTTKGEIIGYAQYFGYSLYFETIIFYIFIFSPLLVFFILSKIRKYKK